MRGQCPQCREPIPWPRRALAMLFCWQSWQCPRCGAWMEVQLRRQLLVLFAWLPLSITLILAHRVLGAYAFSFGLLLLLILAAITSKFAIVTESSTHCHACGYPLAPLEQFAKEEKRLCPECGASN